MKTAKTEIATRSRHTFSMNKHALQSQQGLGCTTCDYMRRRRGPLTPAAAPASIHQVLPSGKRGVG